MSTLFLSSTRDSIIIMINWVWSEGGEVVRDVMWISVIMVLRVNAIYTRMVPRSRTQTGPSRWYFQFLDESGRIPFATSFWVLWRTQIVDSQIFSSNLWSIFLGVRLKVFVRDQPLLIHLRELFKKACSKSRIWFCLLQWRNHVSGPSWLISSMWFADGS